MRFHNPDLILLGGAVLICFIVSVWRGSFSVYLLIDRLTWNSWSSCLGCAPPHPAVLRYSHHTLLWERFLRKPMLEKLANPLFFNPYFRKCIWPEPSCETTSGKGGQDYYFWCWKPSQQTFLLLLLRLPHSVTQATGITELSWCMTCWGIDHHEFWVVCFLLVFTL